MEIDYKIIDDYNNIHQYKDYKDLGCHLISREKLNILQGNPIKIDHSAIQILACHNSQIVGSGIQFPTKLLIDNHEVIGLTCSSLSVDKLYRKQGIASKIHKLRMTYSPSGTIFIGSISQMQLNIMARLNATIFFSRRFIFLKKSRAIIESISHGKDFRFFRLVFDFVLKCQSFGLNLFTKILNRSRFNIQKMLEATDAYDAIFRADNHRFKECHDKRWINWMLRSNPQNSLYYIKQGPEIVGFFVIKDTFYAQASHRGYKNIKLRSIVEWGAINKTLLSDFKICLLALSLPGDVEAVELCPFDDKISRRLFFLGLVPKGKANVVLRFSEDSQLQVVKGIRDASNWRLRPAAGDNIIF